MLFAPIDAPGQPLSYEGRLVTNHTGGGSIRTRELEAAECVAGGVSNGVDGHGGNTYPKIRDGVSALKQALEAGGSDEDKLISYLLELLTYVVLPSLSDTSVLCSAFTFSACKHAGLCVRPSCPCPVPLHYPDHGRKFSQARANRPSSPYLMVF